MLAKVDSLSGNEKAEGMSNSTLRFINSLMNYITCGKLHEINPSIRRTFLLISNLGMIKLFLLGAV